ncbi:MAG: type II secretion system protein [Armatimonadota bacterium]
MQKIITSNNNLKRGFSLLEVIAVTCILFILSAIIYPVIIKSQESAKTQQCLQNLKQIGSGIQLYINSNGDKFPAAVPWGAPNYWSKVENGNQKTIQEILGKYIDNKDLGQRKVVINNNIIYESNNIFVCPSDKGIPTASIPKKSKTLLGVPPNVPVWKHTGSSYEYYSSNQRDFIDGDKDDDTAQWTGLAPALKIGDQIVRVGAPISAVKNLKTKAIMGDIYFWHQGDSLDGYRNTLYADGHVNRVKINSHLSSRLQPLSPWHQYSEIKDF